MQKVLWVICSILLIGCSNTPTDNLFLSKDKIQLEKQLPQVTLTQILPKPIENVYCQQSMDTDLLYGSGLILFNHSLYNEAKSCFIMTAPVEARSVCFLARINEEDKTKDKSQVKKENMDYYAYGATQNDWCAEWALYFDYLHDKDEAKRGLAVQWLEWSAIHGNDNAQRSLGTYYKENNNLPMAYAWYHFTDQSDKNSNFTNYVKSEMTPAQIKEGERLIEKMKPFVVSREMMLKEGKIERVREYSARLYLHYPELIQGKTIEERRSWISNIHNKTIDLPYIKTTSEALAFIVLTGKAQQQKNPEADLANNKKLIKVFTEEDKGPPNMRWVRLVEKGTKALNLQ